MKVSFILLAAGFSHRFQGNKLLSLWEGKPLYQYALDAFSSLARLRPDCSLAAVTRYEQISSHVRSLGGAVLWNHHSEDGLSSSLRLGLTACPEDAYPLFVVADQPTLTGSELDAFLTAFSLSGKGMGCFSHQGTPGNPAIFSPGYRSELFALRGDAGAKGILLRHREDCFLWEGPDLFDVDTPEDLLALQRLAGQKSLSATGTPGPRPGNHTKT